MGTLHECAKCGQPMMFFPGEGATPSYWGCTEVGCEDQVMLDDYDGSGD